MVVIKRDAQFSNPEITIAVLSVVLQFSRNAVGVKAQRMFYRRLRVL